MADHILKINGVTLQVKLTKDGVGYRFQVEKSGVNGYVLVSGWSAGNRAEAIEEARQYAINRIARGKP